MLARQDWGRKGSCTRGSLANLHLSLSLSLSLSRLLFNDLGPINKCRHCIASILQIALVRRQAASRMVSYPLIQGHTEVADLVAWDDESREV